MSHKSCILTDAVKYQQFLFTRKSNKTTKYILFQTTGSKQDTGGNSDHPPNKRLRVSGANQTQKSHTYSYQGSNNHQITQQHQQAVANQQNRPMISSSQQRQNSGALYSSPAQFISQQQQGGNHMRRF